MKTVKLGDYALIQTNKTNVLDANIRTYVSTENLIPNRGGVTFPATTIPTTGKVNVYNSGDILVSNIRPYFKKIWVSNINGTHSSDVLNFRTKSENLIQEFLYILLESDAFFNYVTLTSKGTKMPRGDKAAIMEFKFNLPTISEQKKNSTTILTLEKKIATLNSINDNLAA